MSRAPALDIDEAFNEFDADAVIRTLLPDLLPEEPEACISCVTVHRTAPSSSVCSPS